jgi:cytochrome b6-f complex iron-sulfur subunit
MGYEVARSIAESPKSTKEFAIAAQRIADKFAEFLVNQFSLLSDAAVDASLHDQVKAGDFIWWLIMVTHSKLPRRTFLRYFTGSSIGTIALGYLLPWSAHSQTPSLETLCSSFPYNSRCENYLPGVEALDANGQGIAVDALLPTAQAGDRVLAQGLEDDVYLVIEEGPRIASYGVKSVCTHLGCTVEWNAIENQFNCPCHGSQFDAQGAVLQGPARRPLELITVVVKQNQARLVEREPAIDPRE